MRKLFQKKKPENSRRPLEQQKGRPAFSYYAGDKPRERDVLRERKQEERRTIRVRKIRTIPSILAVLAILISAVYSTTLSTNPVISFAGTVSSYRTKDDYSNRIEKILHSSIKNRSKLTIDSAKTESAILNNFPELDVAKISLPVLGTRPVVTVHVREPAFILTTTTNSFALDDNGRAVADSRSLMSSVRDSLLTVQDQSGLVLKVGDQALTSETVAFIKNVQAQITDKKLSISQAILPVVPNEVDFRLKDIPYYIKTDTSGDPRVQIGAFFAVKDSGVAPAEYMDVRVEEKVFYK